MNEKTNLITSHASLTQFFYKNLSEINKTSICPVPEEFIFYSSEVLDKYSLSSEFFDLTEGKVEEKLVGFNFLKTAELNSLEQVSAYKDIGDTVLVLLGMFKKRVHKKTLPEDYYLKLARMAYHSMEKLDCSFYDIPNFYNLFATSLDRVVYIVDTMFKSSKYKSIENFLMEEGKDKDFLNLNIKKQKVS